MSEREAAERARCSREGGAWPGGDGRQARAAAGRQAMIIRLGHARREAQEAHIHHLPIMSPALRRLPVDCSKVWAVEREVVDDVAGS